VSRRVSFGEGYNRREEEAFVTKALVELAAAIERHTTADGIYETAVPALKMARTSGPTELTAIVYEPCLCLIAQGSKEIVLGDETYSYDPAHSLLASVHLPVSARVVEASKGRPCLVLGVSLHPGLVGEFLADGTTAPPLGPPARGLSVAPLEPNLLGAVTRLVSLLDSPWDIAPLSPLVLREITYRVLTGPHGERLRETAVAGAPAQRVSRAIGWMKDHFAEPFRVESLAKLVKMSQSAFHLHFKAVTGLSPLQYQKRLRLQEARRLMLGEGFDAAEAAFRVGYESPSQFSREYRRIFGAPPHRDVVAIKVESQADA
jgi:AraC-like DNA-binding protein